MDQPKDAPNSRPGTSTSEASKEQAKSSEATPTDKEKRQSFRLSGGSWRGKASAVAEIARESISATSRTLKTPVVESIKPRQDTSPSGSVRRSANFRTPSKSTPIAATTTRLSVSSGKTKEEAKDEAKVKETGSHRETDMKDKPNDAHDGKKDGKEGDDRQTSEDRPLPAAGWRGWWSRPVSSDLTGEKSEKPGNHTAPLVSESQDGKAQHTITTEAVETNVPMTDVPANTENPTDSTVESSKPDTAHQHPSRSSWFGLWGSGNTISIDPPEIQTSPKGTAVEPSPSLADTKADVASGGPAKQPLAEISQPVPPAHGSGGWAFWSREKPKEAAAADKEQPKNEYGELAVANSSSQADPRPAHVKAGDSKPVAGSPSSRKRERPESTADASDVPVTKKSASNRGESLAQARIEQLTKDGSSSDASESSKQSGPSTKSRKPAKSTENLVLPKFDSTYHIAETPSYLQQLIHLLARKPSAEIRHLSISPTVPKIRKAIAIGVHGYFPAPLIQKVLGQPTGTSVRFANGAATAIQQWTSRHGYSCEIEKVALEGEGMIGERVDTLWKLLLNWIDQIRKADFILIACHSQGVPVAIMLLAKLINFGCLSNNVRVGVCSMAGINLGPFASFATQSRLLGPSANELFDFSRPETVVSRAYTTALELCLAKGVRLLYVGSIDDQLVSLESAIFSTVSHPYIYRAVFVDGRIHAPDFLTHLVGFALKLRNLGIQDHGLIRELSAPLAGSLYSGEGHSRIYEEASVYDLAMEFTLTTADLPGSATMETKAYEVPSATNTNPYFLPWALRGLLEEEFVKQELKEETTELLRQFESWKPSSKVLKDVKFRLEAVKSKL